MYPKPISLETILLVSLAIGPLVVAQDRLPELKMASANIRVLDPEGNPVAEATVYCTGLRTKQEPGSHWGWPSDEPSPRGTTDADGRVTMQYPHFLEDKLEVGQVTWSVDHPDFVPFREDRSVDDDPAEIKLVRGFRIAATAVDSVTKQPIKENLYGVVCGYDYRDWKLYENGTLVSPVFDFNQSDVRLVQVVDHRAKAFSDIIHVDPTGKMRVRLENVELHPSVRLSGKLSDNVARPVKNGIVAAHIIIPTSGQDRQSLESWLWYTDSVIADDGSFTIDGLPAGDVIQLIPLCDGWVPQNPTKEEVLQFFPDLKTFGMHSLPTPIRLDDDDVHLELKMIEGKSVSAKVVDENDQPLSDVEVGVWPNQVWFFGGSQLLGDHLDRSQMLEARAATSAFSLPKYKTVFQANRSKRHGDDRRISQGLFVGNLRTAQRLRNGGYQRRGIVAAKNERSRGHPGNHSHEEKCWLRQRKMRANNPTETNVSMPKSSDCD